MAGSKPAETNRRARGFRPNALQRLAMRKGKVSTFGQGSAQDRRAKDLARALEALESDYTIFQMEGRFRML